MIIFNMVFHLWPQNFSTFTSFNLKKIVYISVSNHPFSILPLKNLETTVLRLFRILKYGMKDVLKETTQIVHIFL